MSAGLLPGVDHAAFTVALVDRLRSAGIVVPADGAATFTRGLRACPPTTRTRLYWTARLTLVDRYESLSTFDTVFDRVFGEAPVPLDPHARRTGPEDEGAPGASTPDGPSRPIGVPTSGHDVPWVTRTIVESAEGERAPGRPGREVASALVEIADQRFDDLDPAQLALLETWIEAAGARWAIRRTRRRVQRHTGRVDIRASIAASRGTGFEPLRLIRTRPGRRRRQVVVFCDVSRSMRPYIGVYLHLVRALAHTGTAEVFVFSTTAARLTPVLRHRSVDQAIGVANERVRTRFGGTRIAGSLAEVVASHHGHLMRGAIVVVASDGWDSDDPTELAHVLARIRRRAHRLVWLNPRAGQSGFTPSTGSMSAALPHCDAMVAADTLVALQHAVDVVTSTDTGDGGLRRRVVGHGVNVLPW
ncbi:hypothetical protein SAMN04490240_3465 [Rhodococcus pyridinivorans]|uniref:vWA domain-containing protein n=1 Tax=Rhodococcus pyridinivorans TaxID=103816 RepID=UPI0008953C3C|nr:VWA domain-containing protein [Rhodococcus pyridinivorans]QXF80682.1 VWA domain-containing protein [Rhodococcus pyridinivorans]SED23770.1 hypothetical protein SAMN04490240_3465 [Rhodococcus pyridinivorans]